MGKEIPFVAKSIYANFQILNLIGEAADAFLLKDLITYDIQKAIPVLLKLSVLHVPETPIENYIAYIQSDETARIAYVLEIMDNITFKKDRELITPLLEQTSIRERCLSGRRHFADLPQDLDAELVNFIQASNEWRSVATLDYTLRSHHSDLLGRLDWTSVPASEAHKELITYYLSQNGEALLRLAQFPKERFQTKIEEGSMLSALEKTIILKGTDLFKDIPGEAIFHVAQVTEEERLQTDTTLFNEGDIGDSLYIIVTGEILIHIGDKEVNRLKKGDLFGEIALLDAAPRSASATAVDETILLEIRQDSFYDIMASRIDVLKGILKVLTGRIRLLTDRYIQDSNR